MILSFTYFWTINTITKQSQQTIKLPSLITQLAHIKQLVISTAMYTWQDHAHAANEICTFFITGIKQTEM